MQEIRLVIYILLFGGTVAYGVSLFPALTSGGEGGRSAEERARFRAAYSEERYYCEAVRMAVNCRCFANISGAIRANLRPRVPGFAYADQQELARWQAEDSCARR